MIKYENCLMMSIHQYNLRLNVLHGAKKSLLFSSLPLPDHWILHHLVLFTDPMYNDNTIYAYAFLDSQEIIAIQHYIMP